MYKMKRFLSWIIAIVLFLSTMPLGGIIEVVHADNSMNILFQRIQDPTGKNVQQYVISYSSDSPLNQPVIEITDDGGGGASYRIDTTKYKEADLVSGNQIIIKKDYVLNVYDSSYQAIFNDGKKTIKVTNKLSDGTSDPSPVTKSFVIVSPPQILSTTIVNKTLFVDDTLTVLGSNFDDVNTILVDGVSYPATPTENGTKISVNITSAGIKTGEIRMYQDTHDGAATPATYSNAIQTIYQNSAYVVSKLSNINIDMVQPNTGSVNGGTYVKLRNAAGLTGLNDQVKVYFARIVDGVMESLSTANLATGNSFDPLTNTLTVRTKASTSGPGDARIVITSPDGTSRYDDREPRKPLLYTFVEAANALTLNNINPSNAKASSEAKVTLVGKNIGTLNITGLSYPSGKDFMSSITSVVNQTSGDITTTYVTLNGLKYSLDNQDYTVNVVKKINTVIGGSAKTVIDEVYGGGFTPESSFSTQQDQLYVQLPIVNLGTKEFETYDTVVSTETFIYYDGNDADTDLDDLLIPSKIEEATLSNSFTYNSDFVVPTVTSITPGYGPMDKKITVRIKGSNFYVMQQETQKLKPIVKIGTSPLSGFKTLENIKVINSSTGIEVDGSVGNYKGDTIIGDIPEDPDGNINMDSNIYVYNPDAYNAADPDNIIYFGQPGILYAKFKFTNPDATQYPHIIDVTPSLISSAGGEEVIITGSNFKTNSELYIDGQKVTPITISGTGEKITFKSPKGSPGVVSLQVFNPDSGAMASTTIEYTSIYTSPGITKITPSKGGPNTLVTITGKNFLSSDVTAKPEEVYKLIGARVKFNNKDLSSYNRNSSGSIILKEYNYQIGLEKPVFKNDATFDFDLYRDVVFVDDAHDGVFLPKEEQGTLYLKDGNGNKYEAYVDAEDDDRIKLVDQNGVTSSEITYDYDGDAVIMTFTVNRDGVVTTYNLETKTPYLIKTQAGKSTIVGNMVRVIDDTTLEVTVPPLIPSEGNNDVTVVNPDTASATKQNGFFYYSSMGSKPTITSLTPKEGTIYGGTIIKIVGSDFRDGVEVYFGSEKATSAILSADQKTIYAILPAYPKTLPKGVSSVSVPVVILNPSDGGTTVWGEKFTYRIPTSYPEITKIDPNKWNASGGIDVTIYGKNFVQGEPYTDLNGNSQYDEGEPYVELYNIGTYDKTCIKEETVGGQIVRTIIEELAPRVYFGGELATVKDFLYNRLIVELPAYNGSGAVDVVIVNPDTGTVVKKGGFTYSVSAPKITSVVPAVGPKAGGTEVTIKGSDFIEEDIKVFVGTSDDKATELISGGSLVKPITMANLTVDYDELNPPQTGKNTALTMTYNARMSDETFEDIAVTKYIDIEDEKTDYQVTFTPEDFIDEEPGIDAEAFAKLVAGEETINLKIVDSQMQVMRRLAKVDAANSDDKTLIIHTPPASTIGIKDLQIINNDGGTATSKFQYGNPISIPRIDEIKPNRRVDYTLGGEAKTKYLVEVSTKGGEQIRITGQEFRDGIKVMIGDQLAEVVSKTDLSNGQSELLVKVPVPAANNKNKELKVTVINSDLASAVSTSYPEAGTPPADWYPYWFVYKDSSTNPVITKVMPNKGPRIGGTAITIEGDDFREGAKVFIGGLECTNVVVESYKKITAVTAPLGAPVTDPGSYAVEVKNYENEVLSGTAILENGFTYVSSPVITGIYEVGAMDAEGNYTQGAAISSFKVTGGETVMLEVTDLLDNPTIIMDGEIEKITDYGNIPEGIRGMNSTGEDVVVTGGTKAALVKIQNKLYAIIKTPVLAKDDDNTIILINSDGGVSEPYDAPYILPVPDTPTSLKAEVVDGDTIKLEWGIAENTLYYEIYVSISTTGKKNSDYQYLTSIVADAISEKKLRYYVDGLLPATYYSFKLKSVNRYGGSTLSEATTYKRTMNEVKVTYYQPDNVEQGGLPQNDSIKTTGTGVAYMAGEKSLGNKDKGLAVNFEQTAYYTANPKAVEVSFGLIRKYPGNKIKVNDRSLQLELTANSLAVDEMIMVDTGKASDAVVRITLNRALGSREDAVRISIPKGYKALMSPVGIELSIQVQSEASRVKSFKTPADLTVKYDEALQKNYPGGVYIAYYDHETKKLQILDTVAAKGSAAAKITKSGEYVLIGKITK